jgi:hypothetical protein
MIDAVNADHKLTLNNPPDTTIAGEEVPDLIPVRMLNEFTEELIQCGSTLRGEISAETETARVGDTGDHNEPRVRKLLPANDDALPLYVQTQGAMLGKSGNRLTIKFTDELIAERRLRLQIFRQDCNGCAQWTQSQDSGDSPAVGSVR